jgi:hypothetical protein
VLLWKKFLICFSGFQGENGGVTEKQMPTTENSKESSPPEEDPDDHGPGGAPTNGCGGGGALISGKGQETVTSAVAVVTPIAEGSLLSFFFNRVLSFVLNFGFYECVKFEF